MASCQVEILEIEFGFDEVLGAMLGFFVDTGEVLGDDAEDKEENSKKEEHEDNNSVDARCNLTVNKIEIEVSHNH